jgi:hypothetical protein
VNPTEPTDQTQGGPPEDVVTGFWLWAVALPLMTAGYVVDQVTAPTRAMNGIVDAFAGFVAVVVLVLVSTLLLLMRQGYRWARTVLTGGGAASVVYVVGNLFGSERSAVAASAYAVCVILGAVLIAGGIYLLHRKDAHGFFTR